MTENRTRSSSNGFTLIELLVVIAVISILLAMFAPAMHGMKDYAGLLMCAKRMNQLAEAHANYCADNNRQIAGPNWRRAQSIGWLYSNLRMDRLEHLETGQFWEYLGMYESYRCPSDEGYEDIPWRPDNSRAITSYCMNGSVCGYGKRTLFGVGGDGYRHWDTYRATEYEGKDLILWETNETAMANKGWWWDGANYPHEGITERHQDKGMTVCADGSAEWLLLDDFYEMVSNGQKNRLWNVPSSSNGR